MAKSVKQPLVSVLMPVFNAQKYLKQSIESILTQTYQNFEFIIINDGSTDNSEEIIKSYSDDRVSYQSNEGNQGLIFTLNKGLKLCTGEFIARMDADDIANSERLSKQLNVFQTNPQLGIIGSWFTTIPNCKLEQRPVTNDEIKAYCYFRNPFAHPTVTFRSSIMKELNILYRSDYKHCEDYKMWAEFVSQTESANIPESLLQYRTHPSQISDTYSDTQLQCSVKVKYELFRQLGIDAIGDGTKFKAVWSKKLRGLPTSSTDLLYILGIYDACQKQTLKVKDLNPKLFLTYFRSFINPTFDLPILDSKINSFTKVLTSSYFIQSSFKWKLKILFKITKSYFK